VFSKIKVIFLLQFVSVIAFIFFNFNIASSKIKKKESSLLGKGREAMFLYSSRWRYKN
jgi:hypothetical protein